VLEAVKNVHAIIDQEIAEGTNPENVFICGLSQGGCFSFHEFFVFSIFFVERPFYIGLNPLMS
jgi:lysophospholipase-2